MISFLFGPKCFLGGERIEKSVVPKYYKAADGTWKTCCPKHFRDAGLFIASRNIVGIRNQQQGSLW